MKKAGVLLVAIFAIGCFLLVGCDDWTSGGGQGGFNTSRGAGASVNFGGVYHGAQSGGRAVQQSSGAPITRLVIQQGGNSVRVTDNNGSTYEGTVGSPGAVSSARDGVYPIGAELVQAQVSFSGKDYSSDRDIEFVGVFHAVAVEDVRGNTSEDTRERTDNLQWTTNVTVGSTGTEVEETLTIIAYDPVTGAEVFRSVTITRTTPGGTVISRDSDITDNRTRSTTASTTYKITEANTQFKLEGTWMEKGGASSRVSALSSGSSGVITLGGQEAPE